MADKKPPAKGTDKNTELTPEDIEKMQEALHKANEEAKKYRLEAKGKDEELTELKKAQDSSKSDMEKVREQIAALETRAEKAEREALVATVAQAKKIPAALASRLSGTTQEELEADADGLVEALNLDGSEEGSSSKPPPGRRPNAQLRPGSGSEEEPEETDPMKLAAKVPRV